MRAWWLAAVGAASAAAALAGAAPANASNRFADPAGNGPEPCFSSDPCEISQAIAGAVSSDDVTLRPGTYQALGQLSIPGGVTVHGAPGARPVIETDAPVGVSLSSFTATLRDVDIEHGGLSGTALAMSRGTAERVLAHTSDGVAACGSSGGGADFILRDSVCWNTSSGAGAAVQFDVSLPSNSPTLQNVTAIGGASGYGIEGIASGSGNVTASATNVIAHGGAGDVSAIDPGGSVVNILMGHSNFATEVQSGSGASVTDPGSGTNLTGAPAFVDAALGDFRQLESSTATIDSGSNAVGLGTLDLDGQPRTMGSAPDIGADEIDNVPPQTTIDSGPSDVTNDNSPIFTFSSSEPGSTFECKVDDDTFGACSGSGGSDTTTTLSDGAHTFAVRAIDPASNPDSSPATRNFTVDTTLPDTTITKKPKKKLKTMKKKAKVKVSFSSEPGATFECRLDKAAFTPCASPFSVKAKSKGGKGKKHTISIQATDQAGNTGDSAVVKFAVIKKK